MTILKIYNDNEFKSNIHTHIKNVMNYEFKDPNLCVEALTHSSLKNELIYADILDNEKLEFIGDAVLDLIVSNFLLAQNEYSKTEGELTINRAKLVNEESLYKFAMHISLDYYLRVSNSAKKMLIHQNSGVLADAFEALVGALFLDSDFKTTNRIVLNIFEDKFLSILCNNDLNYKGLLNEYVTKNKLSHPNYEIIDISGPDHDRIYTSRLSIEGKILSMGKGNSIKKAEQESAKYAFERIEAEGHVKN
ncbi:MAG: ribonuclease III [Tissierellia bacterium]|nr:ribonuclease III [Tissierellia bacterium]